MKVPASPPHDCPLCPRLAAFRADNRKKHPDWFNGPVPSFGPLTARLLIAGLAPDEVALLKRLLARLQSAAGHLAGDAP